jgi:hypothetical protein
MVADLADNAPELINPGSGGDGHAVNRSSPPPRLPLPLEEVEPSAAPIDLSSYSLVRLYTWRASVNDDPPFAAIQLTGDVAGPCRVIALARTARLARLTSSSFFVRVQKACSKEAASAYRPPSRRQCSVSPDRIGYAGLGLGGVQHRPA